MNRAPTHSLRIMRGLAHEPPGAQSDNALAITIAGGMLLGVAASALNSLIDDLYKHESRAIARVALLGLALTGGTWLIRRAAGIPEHLPGSRLGITAASVIFTAILLLFVVAYLLMTR
jgi:hypothetical protein